MAMNQLATTVTIPNVTKWQVADYRLRDEDTVPGIDTTVKIWGVGDTLYAQYSLTARGDGTADRLVDGSGIYAGRWRQESAAALANAYSTLLTAYNSTNNHAARKTAISQAMLTAGMLPASMAIAPA